MKFLKFILALFSLPGLFSTGRYLRHLTEVSLGHTVPWEELGYFLLGFSTFCFAYFSLPKANWFYVLGHESTHALAVLLSGGRVSGFKVSSKGGHVITNKTSFFIALSPYIIPFYPLLFGLAWTLALFIYPDLAAYTWFYLILWGGSWSFHACHTISLMKTDQPDFASQGYFFSLTLIAWANLLVLNAILWSWLAPFPALSALKQLGNFIGSDYFWVLQLVKSAT